MRVLYHYSIMAKVLAATLAGFVVLVFAFQYLLHEQHKGELQQHLEDNFTMLQKEIDSGMHIRSAWMDSSIRLFQRSADAEKLVSALQQERREALYTLSLDYYRELKKQNHITHMYFLSDKRRVVLRMHQPDRFGDTIERQSVRLAERSGKTVTGIELGSLGTLTLRVVVPWIHHGRKVGFLELGMEMEEILKGIETNSPFRVILTLDKKRLLQADWQQGQEMLQRKPDWNQLGQYVVAYPAGGAGDLPAAVLSVLNDTVAHDQVVQIEGRLHSLKQHAFVDMTGTVIGHLIQLVDLTRQSNNFKRGLLLTLALFALLVGMTVLLLYLIISRAEKARESSEARLKLASEALAQTVDGVLITDCSGSIVDVNAAFEHVTGFSRDEVIGKKPNMLSSGYHDDQFYRQMWACIKEQGQWRGRIVNRKKSGDTYPEYLSITAVCDERGEVKNYIGVFSDISEQEAMEHQFHEAQRLESLGTLVGGIAHEFNNLLAGITGNLYLARGEVSEHPKAIKHLKTVEQLSFHAAEMIRQLLSFARKGVMKTELLEVNQLLHAGMKQFRLRVPENITLSFRPAAEKLVIEADKAQLQQVLSNLIDNAMDALKGREDPEITISSRLYVADQPFLTRHADMKGRRLLCLSVSDNGCGMSEEELNVIFEPFFTTKGVGDGTGLGLSMVFGAVKSHGGVIEVTSAPDKGSEFRIYCPLREGVVVSKQEGQEIHKGGGETILVVDDDQLIIDTAEKVLTKLGYRVLTASDGREGVERFEQAWQKIDLVMLDLVMPGMGGIEAARGMRNINPGAKIVFVTGYEEPENIQKVMQDGGDTVLRKPYSITQLSALLHGIFTAE